MLFFNSRKYAEETEKKRRKNQTGHSVNQMIALGLLATFPPCRIFLKLHRPKIADQATVEERPAAAGEQVPIIYIHGFRGGDYTTNVMSRQPVKPRGTAAF